MSRIKAVKDAIAKLKSPRCSECDYDSYGHQWECRAVIRYNETILNNAQFLVEVVEAAQETATLLTLEGKPRPNLDKALAKLQEANK